MLDKQIDIYSIDTGDLYSNHEYQLHWKNASYRMERNYLKRKVADILEDLYLFGYSKADCDFFMQGKIERMKLIPGTNDTLRELNKYAKLIVYKRKMAMASKQQILDLLGNRTEQNLKTNGKDHIRQVNESRLNEKKIISIFESSLTRMLDLRSDELSDALLVLQIYYFDVFKDVMYYGFTYKGEEYIYFTSSAGQIRKKKAVFIKKKLWEEHERTIMCGLTIDKINEKGGNNVNKHLAYMALTNSATDVWEDFDIDRTIVIDDFETDVMGTYDLINDEDYSITRTTDYVPIAHTDGAGMVLDGQNRMFRAPWIKGLLGVFNFREWILEAREKYQNNNIGIIKDIYGLEHDIIAENIYVIFTKSQFKLSKFYSSWNEYKSYFKQYGCKAGVCNVEPERIGCSTINYQMLQTLTDVTDEELEQLTAKSSEHLLNITSSLQSLKAVNGVTPYNMNPSPWQEAINIYPDILNDEYAKVKIRDIKNSLVKSYRSGKLEIEGKYTFLLPDFYAACEYWFLGIENPEGLLNDKEVFCSLFKHREKLDLLRSPHLYKEHAIRHNIAFKEYPERSSQISKWFTTNAIYTSCHDLISKILQFDVDGDKSLVVGDKFFISLAERNMNDIVPLYYNMRKAQPCELNNENIYNGLNAAFVGGNIGIYSNNISKIWNDDVFVNGTEEEKQEATNVVKLLCMENNFVIDYAKTLYKPERPKIIGEQISRFTNLLLPHFFVYAKDKEMHQVSKRNKSLVNRLFDIIPNPNLNFRKCGLSAIDPTLLLHNPDIEIDYDLIQTYEVLNKNYHNRISMKDESQNNLHFLANDIRYKLSGYGYSEQEVADMLAKYLYEGHRKMKDILWFCYGTYIVENLKENINCKKTKMIQCIDCGEWFEVDINSKKIRCDKCKHIADLNKYAKYNKTR